MGPRKGSNEQRKANALDNAQLGTVLQTLAYAPRALDREKRDAALLEAAKRLQWRDNYEKHVPADQKYADGR